MLKPFSILCLITLSCCSSKVPEQQQNIQLESRSFEYCIFIGYKDKLPIFCCENEKQDTQAICTLNDGRLLRSFRDFDGDVEVLTIKEDFIFYYDIDTNMLVGENNENKILTVKTSSRIWSAVLDDINEVLYFSDAENRIKMIVLGQGNDEGKELSIKGAVFGYRDNHLYYYTNVGDRPFVNIFELNVKTGKVKELFLDTSTEDILFEDEIILLPSQPLISCRGRIKGSFGQVLFNIDSQSVCRIGNEDNLENLFTYYDWIKGKLVCYNPEDLAEKYYYDPVCKGEAGKN